MRRWRSLHARACVNQKIVSWVRQNSIKWDSHRVLSIFIMTKTASFKRVVSDDLAGNQGGLVVNSRAI
ncbi:repeat set, removed, mycelia-enriched transcript [Histoplasma ohiense]|nr:repeat set, removed, mycelia-enriched transcript [Histoplasma ohiense (nom. inval.)]